MSGYDPLDLTAPGPKYSYLANAPADSPLSYQSLVTRRKIAEALLGKRDRLPFPKNLGEGLTYASEKLADAFTNRQMMSELDTAERRQALGEDALRRRFDVDNPPPATNLQTSAPPAGDTGVPGVPYVPSGPGSVPLPRARPTMDYSKSIAELEADPETAAQAAAITLGERNPKAPREAVQSQYASLLNRAQAHGMTVKEALNNGYYPPDALARGQAQLQTPEQVAAFRRDIADPVLSGAGDPAGLGFPPTQNASGGVAQRGIVPPPGGGAPRYSTFGRVPGDTETFAQKPGENAALERFRNPFGPPAVPDAQTATATPPGAVPGSRDAIAADMMSSTPLAQQQPFGAPPAAPTVPPPATPPPVQVASLDGTGGPASFADRFNALPGAPGALMAGAAAPTLPAGGFAPPAPAPAQATAALPPNPITPTDLLPRPVQTAQTPQGPMAPADVLKEGVPAPFQIQVPPHPGPEIKPPPIPQPTAKMRQLSDIATSGNVSDITKQWAKDRYGELQKQQDREYELAKEDYTFRRGKRETDLEKHEQGLRELDEKQLKQLLERTQLAALKAKTGPEIEKLNLEAQSIKQTLAAGKAPETKDFQGNFLQWDQKSGEWKVPNLTINPQNIKLTVDERKSLNYFENSYIASSQLGDNKALRGLADSIKGRVPIFGNDWVKPEYRLIKSAADAWIMNTLRDQSGATIKAEETKDYYDMYFPRYGDTDIDIAAKAGRRAVQERALVDGLGPVKVLADQFIARREQQKAPEGTPHAAVMNDEKGKPRWINIHGYWEKIP